MEKLVLIDGNSLINRAYYAMPLLLTKDGVPTNAVYGFLNMFFKILTEEKPTYAAVAFDLPKPTFRHKAYSEYKGTRKPSPEELRSQIPLLKEVLKIMGIHVVDSEGFEADDIIGTIAKHTNIQTLIYTGDRDALQLVDNETSVYFTKRGITDIDVYDIKNFKEKHGVNPEQVIELKALMGDSSDNIPGVAGVGQKTALTLIQEYGNIDNLYNNIDKITGKLKEKLVDNKESAYLSKMLATINVDCGVCTDTEQMRIKLPFPVDFKEKLIELELKSLVKREEFFEREETVEATAKIITIEGESSLPKFTANSYSVLLTDSSFNFSDGENEYQIKIRESLLDDGLSLTEAVNIAKGLFNKELIVYDKKDLKKQLKLIGVNIDGKVEDVGLMKYLLNFSSGGETLSQTLEEYSLDLSTPAYSLYKLYKILNEQLKTDQMEELYREIELPLVDVLFSMEEAGFKVDAESLSETGKRYQAVLTDLETQIRDLTNEPTLNVNSPKQLGEVLFEKLKIGKGKKTKSGYSTSAEVLENLEDASPVIPLILSHRRIQKLYSTYIEGFRPLIDKNTGLIHTSFNQTVTATGRLSSKEPNLQNIPVRDSEGKELRKFFVPKSENRVLIGADYSQIELRLLAEFSKTEALVNAFFNGEDVHSSTASKVFNVPLSDVTPEMRRTAKAVNFGIIYGISEYGLAKQIKVAPPVAREYINSYFKEFPEVKKYMDDNVEFAKQNGYSVTFTGRRRYIRELKSGSYPIRQFGERVAMNMPLQGSAADVIKIAMLNVYNRLKKEDLKSELILQVHDELIIDAYIEEQEKVEKILKEEMENAVKFTVPLTVEVGVGRNWYDAK